MFERWLTGSRIQGGCCHLSPLLPFSSLHDKSATWFSSTIYRWNAYPEPTGFLNWFNLPLVFFWLYIRYQNLILFVFVLFSLLIFVVIFGILSLYLQLYGWCFVVCNRFSEPVGYYCCKYITAIFSHCEFSVIILCPFHILGVPF